MKLTNNKYKTMKKSINHNHGSSLIEVLIALVILSVGLLGVGSLQTKTQQFSRSAYFNTQATIFTHDILERARANPKGMFSDFYDSPNVVEHSNCYNLTGCSPQEIAENDMYEWQADVAKTLPGGDSVICKDSTPDDGEPSSPGCDGVGLIYAAKVWWSTADSSTQRVVITTAL